MTEYINKDFYREIPPQERFYINLTAANVDAVMDRLNREGILFSATISEYKNVVTVHKADSERAAAIVSDLTPPKTFDTRIIGNADYRSISDKRYINMDAETALKVAAVLSGDNNSRFSGRIVGDKATITVSGDKNAANVRRMAENIKNTDLLSELDAAGFERVNLNNGFVNFRNTFTGDVEGFDSLDMVREMFADMDNEFFHPTAYRIALTSDAYEDEYYISCYDHTTGEEKAPYFDSNSFLSFMPTFRTVDSALEYALSENITLSNSREELEIWRAVELDRENEEIAEENREHITDFPMQNGIYPDHFRYNEASGSFVWLYFNPDGDNGEGEFVEKYISEQDIYAAYIARANAENETEGYNAFINYLLENCRESSIDTYSGYFQEYADEYINAPETVAEFYGIGINSSHIEDIAAVITLLEESCQAVAAEKSKQAEKSSHIGLTSENIEIEGYTGTWYAIDAQNIQGKDLFLLESEIYGDEASCLIVDENGTVVMDKVYNGFDDYIAAKVVPEGQMEVSGEVASEMWYYGFDVYVNGERIEPYNSVANKNAVYDMLEDKNSTVSADKNDVTIYHIADTIASVVYDVSSKYFKAEKSVGTPYFLNLEKYHEDNGWEHWRSDENEYANAMFALLERNYSSVRNYLMNIISDSDNVDDMAEDRESAINAIKTMDIFKAAMEEYRPIATEPFHDDVPLHETGPAEEVSYAEQLYARVNDEYSYFIGQMKKESPEVLIEAAAEIVDKDKIRLYLEENTPDLSDEQYKALLSRPDPLGEIYEMWVKMGDLNSIDDVGIAVAETADRILISLDREKARPEVAEEKLTRSSKDVSFDVAEGTWHVVDYAEIGGKKLFMLESDNYGYTDEVGHIIADEDRNIVAENVHVGFAASDVANKECFVFSVTQEGETRYYRSDKMTVERLKEACIYSTRPFVYGNTHGERITEVEFAEISQAENGLAVEMNMDDRELKVYGTDTYLCLPFKDIRTHIEDFSVNSENDYVISALDLKHSNLIFSVITIENENPVVVGGFADEFTVRDTDKFNEYVEEYLDDADNVSVEVTVYSVGNPDVESTDLGPEFYEYVQEHFAAIEKRADVLESRRYKLAVEIESDREIFEEEPEISELDKAKKYISDFLESEYRTELSEDNFKDMSHIAIGYTTLGDNEDYQVTVEADLVDYEIRYIVDGKNIFTESYNSLDEMNENALSVLDFDELVSAANDYIENMEQETPDNDAPETSPAAPDEHKKLPLYLKDYNEAKAAGETQVFIANLNENRACAKAIDKALGDCYSNNTLNSSAALESVMQEYDFDRIAHVVAARIYQIDWDGRITYENTSWAKSQFESISPDARQMSQQYQLNTHPGLINLFANTVRKEMERIRAEKQEEQEEEQYGIAEYTDDRPVREEFVSKTAPTMNMIDHILRCGSNEPDSLERIVRQFQKNKSTEENAEFLKKEFGEDGRGYIIDEYSEFRVSAWFDESGIYAAVSDTAFPTGKRSHIGWDKAADRIRELLEKGEYCPQEIIDRAKDNDIQDIARKLWYLRQDTNIPFFIPEHFFDGGFDESTDRIAEVLHESNLLNEISDGLARYIEMLKDDPNILRFRFHNPEQLLERIKDLQAENSSGMVSFKTRPGYMPVEQRFFISEDEKDLLLMHGSGISGGKFRIEEYFKQEHNAKEKADFLKEEYGTGGSGRTGYDTWHDSKGITLRKGIEGTSCQTEMKWNEAAKRIDRLVSAGKYISQKDIEQRIRSAKYDIEHSDINYAHDRTIVESAMKILDEYGVDYDVPDDYDVLCILADRFTEHHDGKFQVEGFYRATNPSTEELADFIQNLLENEKQGFGLKDYAAGPNGIVFTDLTEYSWEQVAKAVASAIDSGKYISSDERVENDDTPKYTIYQIPAGEEYHYIRFTSYEMLEKMGQLPDPKNYEKVYSGRLDDIEYRDKPEGIFVKFNTDRPDDFDGHSLSVSDVIVIDEESGKKAYYVDDVGYKDITDIFLGLTEQKKDTPEQTEEKSEPVITSGIIEKYGLDIDFTKIDSVLLHTESTRYEGGIDENGHERRDNFSRDISDVSIYYSAEDNSFIRSDSSDEAAFFGTDNSKITIDAALTEIQKFLDEAVDDSEKSVYIKYGDGRSQYIDAAKLLEVIKSENEPARKKSGSDIEVGDRFLYNDHEYTVTSEKGIYPYDVSVSYEEKTGDITYIGTQNINRYKLAENGIYLGNPEKEHAQSPVGTETNGESYEPKIGDVIEYQKKLFVIADVSGGNVTLQTADTLIPETTVVPVTDLITSDSLDVVDERGKPAETDVHTKPAEEKPKVRNFVITDDNFGVPGGAKSRYADNVEAIKLLKTIESENRTATSEEQKILAKYTGWGAIPQAFDIGNDKWRDEYMELRTLLTPEEYAAARKSTMNAHYTSPIIISAIYEGLKNLGFEKGKILEPAVGIGNFFGAMPEELRGSKLYGVELDSLTGRIAKQLYPEADIQIKGFEETIYNDNSFDVAIGNVPFGDYKLNDRRYNDNNFLIHDYFFAKALDKVHPGGIVAFVTSKGTLDKENPEVRKYLAQRAELLGAIRLPNNAFKANAGTETTADIIFLQKRERPIEIDPDEVEWLKKEDNPDGFFINNYFVQHPEMVLGKIAEARQIYGPTENTQVLPIEGADLKQQLTEAIKNIRGEYRAAAIETAERNDDEIPAPANSRKYSFYAVDGNLYYREAEDTMKKVNVPKDTLNRAIGLIELRDAVRNLLNLQLNNADGSLDIDIAESRKALNNAYDSFVAKYGNVSDRKNAKAMQGDDGYNIVSALELKDEKGQVTGKADIFTHNTVKPKILTSHVDTAEEALILSIAEKAKVDFEYMTSLCGMAKDKLISELSGQIFRLPQEEEEYVTADEYLTGNIRKKLRELEYAPEDMDVSENRKALEAAMPPRVEAKDISVKLGAHWVDPKYIEDFIKEKFNPDYDTRRNMSVQYSAVAGTWKIEDVKPSSKKNYYCTHTYGTHRKNAYELLEAILNNGDIQVKDRVKDENGNDMRDANGKYILVINDEETKAARRCANMIRSEFQDWIFKDPDRREALVQKYNEVYNSIRHREYDGSHLNFSGMNAGIALKEHQKNAVARGLYGGNCLLAHAVGAGKTFEMIAIAMEGKRLGLHHKCLFAVPNALTEQFGSDFRKLYPNANILVATQKDFEKANRLQLFGKIAANDWDAVIVGHSQFDRMGLSLEKERAYLVEEVNKLRYELEMATDANGGKKSFTVKQIEKSIAAYEDKLEKLNDAQVKDGFIDFEQLGFDKVFVDESHMYKNLATATKMHNVSGLGTQGSARAFNLLMKSKYLDELTGGRGLTFASGTPVSNSMTELYTLMRYLQSGMLSDLGINHFDEWAADFGEVKTDYELKPESDGKYQLKTRFAKFTNLPELMAIFKEAADIRTADTLDLEKPKAVVTEIVAKPSKIQKRAIKSLGKRAAEIRSGSVDPREDNMLKITSDGRKIGLDQRLLNPSLPDDPESKVNLCVKNVFDIYTKTADKRSTQCIFCDLSTPKSETRQDRFIIYRPDSSKSLGYDIIRKKTGIKKEWDFGDIKKHVDKNAAEEQDKLKDGDIVVIRRPSEDMTEVISEAAVYTNGRFITENSANLLEKLSMSPVEDMPPKEFNVYDDIKNKLMEMGVPEKEIAFIHDYDTPEQKQKLFNQMNAGDVRILLGSTSKCGAGMNAQRKMIALHHLDAPMRPSDVEQIKRNIEKHSRTSRNILNKYEYNHIAFT